MKMSDYTPEMLEQARETSRGYLKADFTREPEDFKSDQQQMLPQPPLVKEPVSDERIDLPRDFRPLGLQKDLLGVMFSRVSSRVYTEKPITLLELSFLLWATQGIKSIRGKKYATLRTVPSGGARHAFETYLVIRNVEGLNPGAYHYLPMEHALEFLHDVDDLENTISQSLSGQGGTKRAAAVFYWSMVPYRAEWRYGVMAHRVALIDAGHVGQNLYLACTALGVGACAIAAFSHEKCNELFGLDGDSEFMVYTCPVGAVSESDKAAEAAFYKFVEEQNL